MVVAAANKARSVSKVAIVSIADANNSKPEKIFPKTVNAQSNTSAANLERNSKSPVCSLLQVAVAVATPRTTSTGARTSK